MWQDKYEVLQQIAHKFGTPIYVYDANFIRNQIKKLQATFQQVNVDIHYAMKANENEALLQIIKEQGIGIDAVSPNEISRAIGLGFEPKQILFTPSCPSEEELDFAFQQGVRIHLGAIEYLDFALQNYPDYPVGLRINPANRIGGNQKIATAHPDSKFGIPVSRMDEVLSYINKGLQVNALHLHTGSDVKHWQDLARSFDTLLDTASQFHHLEYLDVGSGFKVKYKDTDASIDLDAFANHIQRKLQNLSHIPQIKIEPGKYIVSEAGVFMVKVNLVKKGFQKTFVGVNSGFHHLIRPMYYDAYHEIVNISQPDAPKQIYDVVGQLCEEDTFAYDRAVNQVNKGDILMIKNAGAYGYSMVSQYNLRELPKQVLMDGDSMVEI